MYYVYILHSSKYKKTYTGYTDNLEGRIQEHNSGKTTFTKTYRPWKLIYNEKYINKDEAIKREKYLKSCAGRKFIKKLLF